MRRIGAEDGGGNSGGSLWGEAISLLSSVAALFSGLFKNIVIGDQVPDYPIKSKNTLKKIFTEVQSLFPEVTTVPQAREQLEKAKQYAAEAYAEGDAVNDTYGMLYDQVAQTLRNYISYDGKPPQNLTAGASTGTNGEPKKEVPWLPIIGGAAILFMLMKKKK